jgi:hypothetical protein
MSATEFPCRPAFFASAAWLMPHNYRTCRIAFPSSPFSIDISGGSLRLKNVTKTTRHLWPTATGHRSLGHRPRTDVIRVFWPKAIFTGSIARRFHVGRRRLAMGDEYGRWQKIRWTFGFLGRCPRLRCNWPSAEYRNLFLARALARLLIRYYTSQL